MKERSDDRPGEVSCENPALEVRIDLHGETERTAVDIKIGFEVPNRNRDPLGPGLRESLFEFDSNADSSLLDDAYHLTHGCYPQPSTLKWGEYVPVRLHLNEPRH